MPKSILVIDDEPEIRDLLVETLATESITATGVGDGQEALEYLRSRLPDLILCDRMMPGMDGIEFVSRVRANPRTAGIPFVFLTGMADSGDFRTGMDSGADDYVAKPWTKKVLLNVIRSKFRRQEELARKQREELLRLTGEVRRSIPREMLNPLHGLIRYSDVLAEHCDNLGPDYVAEISRDIRKASRNLLRKVENFQFLLELSIAAGQEPAPQKPQPAGPLLRELATAAAHEGGRSADLKLRIAESCACVPGEARKILTELLDNAFGFSEPGTVVEAALSVTPADRGPERTPEIGLSDEPAKMAEITIADRGAGIPQGLAADLMGARAPDRFLSANISKPLANGTGLLICRELLQRLHGAWHISARPGGGTSVCVSIPVVESLSARVEAVTFDVGHLR